MVGEKLRISFVRIDAVAGRAKTLSTKAFTGFATKRSGKSKDFQMISQRMASGQTHVNIFGINRRKLIKTVSENNTQRV